MYSQDDTFIRTGILMDIYTARLWDHRTQPSVSKMQNPNNFRAWKDMIKCMDFKVGL